MPPMYVDGFVIVMPKKNIAAYKKIATMAAKVWMKYGALDYKECVGEDVKVQKGVLGFPKLTKLKKGEAVVFSYILYKSRKHRDAVNKKVMADPAMNDFDEKDMPFKMNRMSYGGFEVIVDGAGR
jgi:uncharacterized protein YbaA (DUF1428 family)